MNRIHGRLPIRNGQFQGRDNSPPPTEEGAIIAPPTGTAFGVHGDHGGSAVDALGPFFPEVEDGGDVAGHGVAIGGGTVVVVEIVFVGSLDRGWERHIGDRGVLGGCQCRWRRSCSSGNRR